MRSVNAVSALLLATTIAGCGIIPAPTPFVMPTNRPENYSGLRAKETAAPQFTALAATASAEEGSLRQWASDAEGAFAESDTRYVAEHATGAPDYYPQCSGGDQGGFRVWMGKSRVRRRTVERCPDAVLRYTRHADCCPCG